MATPEGGVGSSGAAPRLKLRGVKLLHRELQDVLAKPIPGIQVEPNESDIFTLSATIEGPGTRAADAAQMLAINSVIYRRLALPRRALPRQIGIC